MLTQDKVQPGQGLDIVKTIFLPWILVVIWGDVRCRGLCMEGFQS